jgi:DNA-binding FadR family transcriptional regulator
VGGVSLRSELAQPRPLSRSTREWLATSVLPLLELAQRRITKDELGRLEAIVAMLPDYPPARGGSGFRIRFWLTIARATRNPLIMQNVRRWAHAMRERERRTGIDSTGPARIIPKAKYRGLLLAMRRGAGAPELWAQVIDDMID